MGHEDDRDLMLRVGDGSHEAFDELVSRFEGRLLAYFYRQCGDRGTAEEAAQEVFLRLWKARERYGPQSKFSTFLFTIARNYWIDVTRARRVRPQESSLNSSSPSDEGTEWAAAIPGAEPEPMRAVERDEDVDRLRRALDRLPQGQKDVVLLGVIEALPYADVAQMLGIPVGTVKSRVHAAVKSLSGILGVDEAPTRAGGTAGERGPEAGGRR
jgi:RNA polymerase sigma-70 factor (ECF subfamily)